MKTQVTEQTEIKSKNIQLVKGEFTPSEASDIINSLIDRKINFHKIQRLQFWEGHCNENRSEFDGRIKELELEKQNAKKIIDGLRKTGGKARISGVLEISAAD